MVVIIGKNTQPEEIKTLIAAKKANRKGLREHVGKLKRGLDGLAYQQEVRHEWD